jgi:LysM repeat protein
MMSAKPLRVTFILFFFLQLQFGLMLLHAQCAEEPVLHQVQTGQSYLDIAVYYGSEEFAELLADFNNYSGGITDALESGSIIRIPAGIATFKNSSRSLSEVKKSPHCTESGSLLQNPEEREFLEALPDSTAEGSENEFLEKFREAFDTIVESEADTIDEQRLQQAEEQILLEIDGLVMDETRSKIGKDFYDVFYQRWEAPESASNFTIRISERPTPTLGSFVSVRVNDNLTFQYRLQPRYDIIETAAIYAVRMTRQYLANNQQNYRIY